MPSSASRLPCPSPIRRDHLPQPGLRISDLPVTTWMRRGLVRNEFHHLNVTSPAPFNPARTLTLPALPLVPESVDVTSLTVSQCMGLVAASTGITWLLCILVTMMSVRFKWI